MYADDDHLLSEKQALWVTEQDGDEV